MTRIPRGRRCVTPDPPPVMPTQERTLLVLDLRRSHSQETLSCHAVRDPLSLLIKFVAASSQYFGTSGTLWHQRADYIL